MWSKSNVKGNSEELLKIANGITELSRMAITKKIEDLQRHILQEEANNPAYDFSFLKNKVKSMQDKIKI